VARRALMLREGKAPVWDRLLTMIFLAALLHGLVILGVTFKASAGDAGGAPGLEVLLVSDELPESDRNPSATYLAQRTQIGSGNSDRPLAPRNRAASVSVAKRPGARDGHAPEESSERGGSAQDPVLTTTAWSTQVRYLASTGPGAAANDQPLLVDPPPSADPAPADEPGPAELRGPKREELWISPDTQASTLAPYLDAWRHKVERIGTLNYPTAARAATTPLSPVVEVALASSGALETVVIRRSSGNPELDQAALAILKLASPFDPFPPELAAQTHVLHFAYEWQFSGGRVGSGTVSTVP
jgi:periplasmic protein TonB